MAPNSSVPYQYFGFWVNQSGNCATDMVWSGSWLCRTKCGGQWHGKIEDQQLPNLTPPSISGPAYPFFANCKPPPHYHILFFTTTSKDTRWNTRRKENPGNKDAYRKQFGDQQPPNLTHFLVRLIPSLQMQPSSSVLIISASSLLS